MDGACRRDAVTACVFAHGDGLPKSSEEMRTVEVAGPSYELILVILQILTGDRNVVIGAVAN